jgi:hypothetical protein
MNSSGSHIYELLWQFQFSDRSGIAFMGHRLCGFLICSNYLLFDGLEKIVVSDADNGSGWLAELFNDVLSLLI